MIGAGTFINPLLKIVTVFAVLGAAYLFIVKPALDTTEEISGSINDSIGKSLESTNNQIDQALSQVDQSVPGTQSFNYQVTGSPKEVQKVVRCIERAENDVARIQGCLRR